MDEQRQSADGIVTGCALLLERFLINGSLRQVLNGLCGGNHQLAFNSVQFNGNLA